MVTLIGALGCGILMGCGGKGAADSDGTPGGANHAGIAGDRSNTDMAGRGGTAGGAGGTVYYPPGCETGVIASYTQCVAAAEAWAWASSAGVMSMSTGGTGSTGGAGGEAGSEEAGVGGADTEPSTPEGCPRTYLVREHLELGFSTTYDGGTRMGDECCYTSFQPCG